MPRNYRNIKVYEKEISKLKEEEKTNWEICEKIGIEIKQLKNIINRYNRNKEKPAAGIVLRKKADQQRMMQ